MERGPKGVMHGLSQGGSENWRKEGRDEMEERVTKEKMVGGGRI